MTPSQPRALAAALRTQWAGLAAREQSLVLAAAAVLGLALLWWLLLAPALAQLRGSPARHAALDAELQHMQTLQAEALRLRDVPRPQGGEARRALQGALAQQLGAAAQINIAGDRATVTLKGVAPEALAQWLAQVRSQARAVPVEARLVKSGAGNAPARWDGTLVLALPPG
ncbi:MAG: type II secretion system protein M [Comamonadaceae bacterium]|nr:type II secretion system protein M [Pseudomonadota bacterium]MDE2415258.1 type II secretion system protein M [Comamonadaceae bacterium]